MCIVAAVTARPSPLSSATAVERCAIPLLHGGNRASLIEGEGPQWRAWSTLRWASSANHVFGHEVTSGETFTWLHSPVFRATPLDMKAEADIDFVMGENQLRLPRLALLAAAHA